MIEEEEEAAMREAMVEVEEDERPDDGSVEIPSDDEYHWIGNHNSPHSQVLHLFNPLKNSSFIS